MGALSPTQGVAHDDGTLSFDAGPDGHFYIQALVNGGRVTFMVDTGATDVVLAPDDARRIGIDPASLVFDQFAETANGRVSGAAIRLDSLVVGLDRDEPAARDGQRRRHVGKPAGHGIPQPAPWLARREWRADPGSLAKGGCPNNESNSRSRNSPGLVPPGLEAIWTRRLRFGLGFRYSPA